jgi:hypothetical protein
MSNVNISEEFLQIPPVSNNVSTTDKSHGDEEEEKKNEDVKENKEEPKPYQIMLKSQDQPKKEESKNSEFEDYFLDSNLDDYKKGAFEIQEIEKVMNRDNQIPNKEKEEDKKHKKKKKNKKKKDKKKDKKKKVQKKKDEIVFKGKTLIIKDNIKHNVCPNKNKIIGRKTKSSRKRLKKKILLIRSQSNEPKEFNNIAQFRLIGSNAHNNTDNTDDNINASSLLNLNINRSHGHFAVYNNVSNYVSNNDMNNYNHYQNNENDMTNFITRNK